MSELTHLTERARHIFRHVVESYLETGAPIGSQSLSQSLRTHLSPASIRATMAELEVHGLLYAPHVSAGRMPTQTGLRIFIDGLLQVGELNDSEREAIAPKIDGTHSFEDILHQAVDGLSGLSQCASLVLAPNNAGAIKHIEFVPIADDKILVILVDQSNHVENRLIERPPGLVASALTEASNYLNGQLKGRSLGELRRDTQRQMATLENELGKLTAQLVETGLAQWGGGGPSPMSQSNEILGKNLLVRGHSHLLDNLNAMEDLERIRLLFEDLDRKKEMISLLSQAEEGDGVKIFIGAETSLFSLSGSSVIISPYKDSDQQVVGVLGVIAPTRTNYARLIPMVDHTAQVVSKLLA